MVGQDDNIRTKRSKPKTANRKKKIRWTDKLFEEKIMEPLAEGATINEIAKSLKLTRQSVTLRLKEHGLNNKTEAMQELLRRAKERNPL